MLRKCTLKILPRSPNQRITSKISRAGSSSISADRALAEIEPVIGALVHLHEALQPLDGAEHAGHAAVARRRVGVVRMAGEAHLGGGRDRHDAARKWSIRSQFSSSSTTPARPGRRVWSALSQRNAALREPPRPGSRSVRGMPMMFRVVFGGRDAGRAEPLDQRADAVDLALPLGVLAQQDVRALLPPRSAATTAASCTMSSDQPEAFRRARDGGSDRRGSSGAGCPAGRRRHG